MTFAVAVAAPLECPGHANGPDPRCSRRRPRRPRRAGVAAAGAVAVPEGVGAIPAAAEPDHRGTGDANRVLAADRGRDGPQFPGGGDAAGLRVPAVLLPRHDPDDPAVHGDFFDDFDY